MNIAVFVSGNGSNLQALIEAESRGDISPGKISLVVCDNPQAYALERAAKAGKKVFVLEAEKGKAREEYDRQVAERLEKEEIGGIVLAGFMRILSGEVIDRYKNRILNIHPSLLPKFKGARSIKDAFEAGTKETGVTVHFVTSELDAGPIILQEKVSVDEGETLETLKEKIHRIEHKVYPEVVKLFTRGKLKIQGDKVEIKE